MSSLKLCLCRMSELAYIYIEREMILGNISNLKNIFEKKLGV